MIRMKKGFTLIELLVVIAIIGILSSVVLASLNSARSKGDNAAIESNLANMMPQAANDYDTNSQSYANVCSDSVILNASTSISNDNGKGYVACNGTVTTWVMMASLPTPITVNGTTYNDYCVDSNGYSGGTASSSINPGAACK